MTKNIPMGSKNNASDEGWRAQLKLEICRKEHKSVIAKSSQNGPLTIQSPFYPEGDVCHLYLLHPPAGIVGGDYLLLEVSVTDRGAALITTPGATKFYRTNGKIARQKQVFKVSSGAALEWLPQETIYFPEAYAQLDSVVHLEEGARFLGWDIHCLGLPANDLTFEKGKAKIGLQIYRGKDPVFIDAMFVSEEKRRYQAAFLRGYSVIATFIATGADCNILDELHTSLPQGQMGHWAATLMDDLLILRYLGASANEARKLFVNAWQQIRPHTLDRLPCLPRIWAT